VANDRARSSDVQPWYAAYIGLPFRDFGRDRTGIDCWGLVRLVLAERAGADVPTYGAISAMDLAGVSEAVADALSSDVWPRVTAYRPLDVVVMRGVGRGCHMGILVEPTKLLHIEASTNSVCVPLRHPSVAFRILSVHRHRDLA
jgi:cell wall-associated NlpC family hydrolase